MLQSAQWEPGGQRWSKARAMNSQLQLVRLPNPTRPLPLHSLAAHVAVPARLAERMPREQDAGPYQRAFLHCLRQPPVCSAWMPGRGMRDQREYDDRRTWQAFHARPAQQAGNTRTYARICAPVLSPPPPTKRQQRPNAQVPASRIVVKPRLSMPSSTRAARAATRLSGSDSRPGRLAVQAVTCTWASHRPAGRRVEQCGRARGQTRGGDGRLKVQAAGVGRRRHRHDRTGW